MTMAHPSPALRSPRGTFFLEQQLTGVAAGIVLFVIAAKVDAARLERHAWHLMGFALATMTAVLIFGSWHYGSKRFLYGNSLQPSEFAKFAVIVWVAMLIVKKGETLRRLSKGLLPFLVVIGVLDLLAILEPDLSVAMLFTLLTAMLLALMDILVLRAIHRAARRKIERDLTKKEEELGQTPEDQK